jgi:hypothetical protein
MFWVEVRALGIAAEILALRDRFILLAGHASQWQIAANSPALDRPMPGKGQRPKQLFKMTQQFLK